MWQKVAKFKGAKYFRKALYIEGIKSNKRTICDVKYAFLSVYGGAILR